MDNENTQQRRKSKKLFWIILFLTGVLIVSMGVWTYSRYMINWSSGRTAAEAESFYFTSDVLNNASEEMDIPAYQLSEFKPGETEVTLKLRNYADELRRSKEAIKYNIAVVDKQNIVSTALDSSYIEDSGNGSLTSASSDKNSENTVILRIPKDYFKDGKAIIEVQAISTAPYSQKLAAVYELYEYNDKISLSAADSKDSNAVVLTVTTTDANGKVIITYPADVLMDKTDSRLTLGSNNTCSFDAVAKAQYTFTFFKKSPSELITTEQFSAEYVTK